MFIEQAPWFYRILFPGVTWRIPSEKKCVYLTFDDGPIPDVTPWVLDTLDKYGIKYKTFKDLEWDMCYPLVHYNRSIDKNKEVFDICNTDCNSIALSKMYICPVASTLGIDNMQEFSSNEMVDLSKERNLKEVKKDLISFYSVNYSSACDFCNKILGKKVTIPPAEQFTGEELKNRG